MVAGPNPAEGSNFALDSLKGHEPQIKNIDSPAKIEIPEGNYT
jgi:hypothetical protein